MLKLKLRSDEEGKDLAYKGLKEQDLRNWYLAEMEKSVMGANELESKRKLVDLVIRRLCKTENLLIEYPGTSTLDNEKFLKWSPLDP